MQNNDDTSGLIKTVVITSVVIIVGCIVTLIISSQVIQQPTNDKVLPKNEPTSNKKIEPIDTVICEYKIIGSNLKVIKRNQIKDINNYEYVHIADGVERIESAVFMDCNNLKKVILPTSLKYIGKDAFKNCTALNEMNIPDSLNEILDNPFIGINKLQLQFDNQTNSNGIFKIIRGFLINIKDNAIVSYLGNNSIINDIPNEIEIIGHQAFSGKQSIVEINLSQSNVSQIQSYAFEYCTNIQKIQLPKSLSEMGINPFKGIHINTDNKFKNDYFLLDKGLLVDKKNRVLVAYIGNSDKVDLNVKSLNALHESIKKIADCSFYDCDFVQDISTKNITIEEIGNNSGLTKEQIRNLKSK